MMAQSKGSGALLEIHELTKSFGGNQVINSLNLSVPEHSIFGFIGPNGSGKTTTMKMVLGLLKPDSGSIWVSGEKVSYGETKTNRLIGYLPDVPEFYGFLTPVEYLRLCGQITGMSKAHSNQRGAELLELVGLGKAKRRIAGFSRGMKQRLGIAQALLNEPRLLICDEPTSALDPRGRKEILNILSRVRGKTTVLFSTHVLSDVERICDRIALLNEGGIVLCGTLDDIKARHSRREYLLEFSEPTSLERYREALSREHHAKTGAPVVEEGLQLTVASQDGGYLIHLLSRLEITPTRFEMKEPNLEDLFLEAITPSTDKEEVIA